MIIKTKILVTDDQPYMRCLLTEVLQSMGYQVIEASNGKDCCQKVRQHHPDLVLLDVKMPGLDGVSTLREIRYTHPSLPVILMTAYEEPIIVSEGIDTNYTAVIIKPFNIFNLLVIIDSCIAENIEEGIPRENLKKKDLAG